MSSREKPENELKNKYFIRVCVFYGVMLAGLFAALMVKMLKALALFGALTNISFPRAVIPFIIFVALVCVSLVVCAALAFRSPNLGDGQEKGHLDNLQNSSSAGDKT